MKSIYELNKADVEQYLNDKGIKHCAVCGSKNTIEPVYDDDLKAIFKKSVFLKYDKDTDKLEPVMNGFEVAITCAHCGALNYIAPGNIAEHLKLQK